VICPITFKRLAPANYNSGVPGDFVVRRFGLVAVASSGRCGHAREAQCNALCRRSQCSALCNARAAKGGAGEEERRRDEGAGDGAKEVARAAGGKAAGAWVIGG
jgi:hypothetical protein